ncbi:MAG: NFACT family protein [Mogibacterium sp.]|nr:NFACT family protein [Mogibacterium sp.]
MAYDGIITYGISLELARTLVPGKIEKVYQPGPEELILQVHAADGNHRLLLSCGSQSARACLTEERYRNPEEPPAFCMLLRKHIQSGHITDIRQNGSERIIEIDIETVSELGFRVSKRLIIEIMGKHSNIVLLDIASGKVIDSIKRISIDVNRYRQLLPGVIYQYPPAQDRLPFKAVATDEDILRGEQVGKLTRANLLADPKYLMNKIAGISPGLARELAAHPSPAARLREAIADAERAAAGVANDEPPISVETSDAQTSVTKAAAVEPALRVYLDAAGSPVEFHITRLSEYAADDDPACMTFETVSAGVEYFYQNRERTNTVKMRSQPLLKSIRTHIEKAQLKKQRIQEDILRAEDADKYRLYGELLTASLHLVTPGARSVTVTNYYTGEPFEIPLDEKLSGAKNAQHYYKLYAKSRNALKEKAGQLADTEADITYLESVLQSAEAATTEESLDAIRDELVDTGFLRSRSSRVAERAIAKAAKRGSGSRNTRGGRRGPKPDPIKYTVSDGSTVYVGRNNTDNDYLTTRFADRGDLWFHTKDIPGSHVILPMGRRQVEDLPPDLLYEVAAIAAYHSKAQGSENVPVDFTYVKYVKKPGGARPGMVIFTHNTTVYVNPALPR